MIESYFNMDIEIIIAGPNRLKEEMKWVFNERDGLTDSIELCLRQSKIPHFRNMLNTQVRPNFLRENINQLYEIKFY